MRKTTDTPLRSTIPFKLKDRPSSRAWKAFKLKGLFGFIPEIIIISKVQGQNNKFIFSAVLTEEEIKKENTLKTKKK